MKVANISYKLNLGEPQADDIPATFNAGSTKGYTPILNEALSGYFFIVFNESWVKGRGGQYQKLFDCRSCMFSAGFCACT